MLQSGHKARAVSFVRLYYRNLFIGSQRPLVYHGGLAHSCVETRYRDSWLDALELFGCIQLSL